MIEYERTLLAYGVRLCPDGPLAMGATAGPRLSYARRDAIDFRNGLRKHGFPKAQVVAVKATFETAKTMRELLETAGGKR